jgi:hypothetical protein
MDMQDRVAHNGVLGGVRDGVFLSHDSGRLLSRTSAIRSSLRAVPRLARTVRPHILVGCIVDHGCCRRRIYRAGDLSSLFHLPNHQIREIPTAHSATVTVREIDDDDHMNVVHYLDCSS